MQTREYAGTFKILLLHEQLEAVPGMAGNWGGTYDGTTLTLQFPDTVDPAAVDAVIAAHNPAGETTDEASLRQVIQMAASAVGVRLQDLTAAQIKSLLAVLLYNHGAIDKITLTIRPLKEWA